MLINYIEFPIICQYFHKSFINDFFLNKIKLKTPIIIQKEISNILKEIINSLTV